jgi:signal transduction histidine kinase
MGKDDEAAVWIGAGRAAPASLWKGDPLSVPEAAASQPVSTPANPREPLVSYLFISGLFLLLATILGARYMEQGGLPEIPPAELAFWFALLLVMNLIPFNSGPVSFTLDTPLLLTIALLYPPYVACFIALVASMDIREVRRQVGPMRALFNRTQIALSVLLAGVVFRTVTGGELNPSGRAAIGTATALVAFHVVNTSLVGVHTALRSRITFREAFRALTVGPVKPFLATYLGYGVLALVLAHLFVKVGPWSTALFLIPLVVAQLMLVRGEALTRLTNELRHRERLLEKLFDRIVEERRDERLRIATGLHDDVLQSLVRISQLGYFLKDELGQGNGPRQDAQELFELSRQTGEKLRHVLSDLQRSPVGRGGLVSSLKTLVADLQLDWQTRITLDSSEDLALSAETQMVGYQSTREAVINSLKHAQATAIEVTLRRTDGDFLAVVHDDGLGFDPSAVDESQHFGLGLMRTRVKLAGGDVDVVSKPEEGTTVLISLPASKEPAQDAAFRVADESEMPNGAGV